MEKVIQGLEEQLVLCLEKRYGNFVFGQYYVARARSVRITKTGKEYSSYYIVDEDGDDYTIAPTIDTLEKNWKWKD